MLRAYGIAGFLIMALGTVLLFLDVEPVPMFFTPIMWWGYILFVDSLVLKLSGGSLITTWKRSFLWMLPISIVSWLIFEAYNLRLANWEYLNMSESFAVRLLGYILSFATITPAIYETAHLVQAIFFAEGLRGKKVAFSRGAVRLLMIVGALFMIVPLLVPAGISRYLFGLVWVGAVPLFDPLSRKLGAPSLLADLARGEWAAFHSFFVSGLVCGFLWEFWNAWAWTRWVYRVPFGSGIKFFEMPSVGFLGFLPFALECYVMFNVAAALLKVPPVLFRMQRDSDSQPS
jgi:hypothetical protein